MKIIIYCYLGLIFCFFHNPLFSQIKTSTIIPQINASGGMTIDKQGNIYVSDFGPGTSVDSNTTVYKIDKNDFTVSVFAEGFMGASGACFDSQGNFYQSNNNGNKISKITPDGTVTLDWVTDSLNQPIGIIADSKDDLYVCNCSGNSISKITSDGSISTFSKDSLFNCPNGITVDPDDNLYVCNFSDGKILKITPDGKVEDFATLPALFGGPNPVGNGHLTYSNGYLYVALIGIGQIQRVCLEDGTFEGIAGRPFGFSNFDGLGLQSTFSKPNGIIASLTGDTLFVNGAQPCWVCPNAGSLHPANVRMITGINSLPDDLCEGEVTAPPIFTRIGTGDIIQNSTISMGSSWADFDKDGYVDVFISVGGDTNRLYKNNGDLTFSLVQDIPSFDIGNTGASIWGDYNNDGYPDLYVSNNPIPPAPAEPNFLYLNEGPPNYTFKKIENDAPVLDSNYTWSSSWVDYDNDGDIDLHVTENRHLAKDLFYENLGTPNSEGRYFQFNKTPFVTDSVESTGVASWMDYDNDGDQDLFLIKSGRTHPDGREENRFYHNTLSETGTLDFKRVLSPEMVTIIDRDFQASWGDYDNDGDMDVYLGNFDGLNYLYRNEGDSLFSRIMEGRPAIDAFSTLGSTWADFDNDGDLDLFSNNSGGQNSAYYENDGQGNFKSRRFRTVGAPVVNVSNTQSCASADINNDGYLDLYVANANSFFTGRPQIDFLYLNSGGNNGYLMLNLEGVASNASAIGAKVRIKTTINDQESWQMRVLSGSPTGDRAQNSLRLHFGVGEAEIIDSLIVEWPSGAVDVIERVVPKQICNVTEGGGTTCLLDPISSNSGPQILSAKEFSIWPNPADEDTLQIQYTIEEVEQVNIVLYTIEGKPIKSIVGINSSLTKMDIKEVVPGLYLLSLHTEKGTVSKKVLIR